MAIQIDLVQETSGTILLRWVIDARVIGRHNLHTAEGLATYLERCQLFSLNPENVRQVANKVLENPSSVPALKVTIRQPALPPGSSASDRRGHDQVKTLQTLIHNLRQENTKLARERDQLRATNAGLEGRLAAANEDMSRRQRLFEYQLNAAEAQVRAFRQKQEEHRSQATRHAAEKRQLERELEEMRSLLAEANKPATSETPIQAARVWK